MKIRHALLATGVLIASAFSPLIAAQPPDQAIEQDLDEGLKEFGYLSGLAHGCVASQQQSAFEREVIDHHAAISRLLGTDRAFLFAAAFGHGTAIAVEMEACQDVLSRYEKRVESFRASQRSR